MSFASELGINLEKLFCSLASIQNQSETNARKVTSFQTELKKIHQEQSQLRTYIFQSQTDQLQQLSDQMRHVQRVLGITNENEPSVNRLLHENSAKIKQLENNVAKKATLQNVESLFVKHDDYVKKQLLKFEMNMVNRPLINSLESTQGQLAAEMSLLKKSLVQKMDKINFIEMKNAMCKVDNFCKFYDQISTQLQNVQTSNQESSSTVLDIKKCLPEYSSRITKLEKLIEAKLNREIFEKFNKTIANRTSSHAVNIEKASRDIESLQLNVESISRSLNNWQKQLSTTTYNFQKLLQQKASGEEVCKKADIIEVNSVWKEVKREINCKVWKKDFLDLEGRFKSLESNTLKRLTEKVDISIRFINWFSKRGQVYESNFLNRDKYLREIVLASAHTIND